MKFCFIILLLLNFSPSFCQISFTSPITIHLPAGEIEKTNRVITFENRNVTISTETAKGKDIQKFLVKSFGQRDYLNVGISDIIVCSSADGFYETHFIMPTTPKPEFIDVVQPQQRGNTEMHYRFLVDR